MKPVSEKEAVRMALEQKGNFKFLAGGTDIMVNKFQGTDKTDAFIDISSISELRKVFKENGYLKIGALVKLGELKSFDEIKNEFPALISAAGTVASPVIRKSATLAGNLLCENRCTFYNQSEWWRQAIGYCLKCNGDICIATGGRKNCFSKFVSDTAPVLISLNASLEIECEKGNSIVRVEDIYTGNGIVSHHIKKSDLIKYIVIPLGQNAQVIFKKLRQRESLEFTSLSSAVSLNKEGTIKIVLSGVDPKPIVAEGKTGDDLNELIQTASKKARIIDNDIFPRKYRKEMIRVFLTDSFKELGLLA